MDHRYFPFFVDITGKKVLQVGAGNIALRRIESLLRFGADDIEMYTKAEAQAVVQVLHNVV